MFFFLLYCNVVWHIALCVFACVMLKHLRLSVYTIRCYCCWKWKRKKKNHRTNGRQLGTKAEILHILWHNAVLKCTKHSFHMHIWITNYYLVVKFNESSVTSKTFDNFFSASTEDCVVRFCTCNQLILASCWRVNFIHRSAKSHGSSHLQHTVLKISNPMRRLSVRCVS